MPPPRLQPLFRCCCFPLPLPLTRLLLLLPFCGQVGKAYLSLSRLYLAGCEESSSKQLAVAALSRAHEIMSVCQVSSSGGAATSSTEGEDVYERGPASHLTYVAGCC